jgi:hypothetical protein
MQQQHGHLGNSETLRDPAEAQEKPGDAATKEKLRGLAAARKHGVQNGRFFFSAELNALTYWYEDQTRSTRMVYLEAAG